MQLKNLVHGRYSEKAMCKVRHPIVPFSVSQCVSHKVFYLTVLSVYVMASGFMISMGFLWVCTWMFLCLYVFAVLFLWLFSSWFLFLSYSGCFILLYYYALDAACFLSRGRKGVDPSGREGGGNLEESEEEKSKLEHNVWKEFLF